MNEDEVFILFDIPKVNNEYMNINELHVLKDVGIETIQCVLSWEKLQPQQGIYNWKEIENRILIHKKVGMKTLIQFPAYHTPHWFPDSWYTWIKPGTFAIYPYEITQDTVYRGIISPWNYDAQEYKNQITQEIMDHFIKWDIMPIGCHMLAGESILINNPVFFNPLEVNNFMKRWETKDFPKVGEYRTDIWLKETCIKLSMDMYNILIHNTYSEIWSTLHPVCQYLWPGTGVEYINDIYDACLKLNPSSINQIWYTFIQHPICFPIFKEQITKYKLNAYGGAEYADGLTLTVPKAKELGFQGLIICPLHPFTGYTTIEPWMIDNIKDTLKHWS
jgi:hypothetical protein